MTATLEKNDIDLDALRIADEVDKIDRATLMLKALSPKLAHDYDGFLEVGSCLKSCGESMFVDWYEWGHSHYSPYCDGTLESKAKRSREWERFPLEGDGTIRLSQIEFPRDKEITNKSAVYTKLEKMWSKRLRLNTMSKEVELDGKKLTPDYLYLDLLKYGISSSKDFVIDCVAKMSLTNEYNPLVTYLNKCHSDHPDSSILDTIATDYLGTTEPIYNTMVKKTLIAAVARAFRPGCKVDTTLILQGGQGIGKSTFFKVLAGDWFDDGLGSNVTDQNEKMRLSAHWILEWGELERIFSQRDASSIKAFLTSTHDSYRRPWGKTIETYPRHCVIVGSTNRDDFLNDSTGSRRFWVVPINQKINIKKLASNRAAIWGAAVACYLKKEQWFLTHQEEIQRQELNKEYQKEEPWFEAIANYCGCKERVTTTEILDRVLKIELGKQDKASQMRVTEVLRAIGWHKKPSNGIKFWVSPQKFYESGGTGGTDTTKSYTDKELEDSATSSATSVPPINAVPPENTPTDSVSPKKSKVALASKQVTTSDTASTVPPVPPKSAAQTDPLKVGDRVRIKSPHFLSGKTGKVLRLGNEFAVVGGNDWAVEQHFKLDQLERVR